MGPPHSPSHVTSPIGWTSSSEEPASPPRYHPYHLRGCPQGIRVKKSQGTSPHPQPRVFSLVDSLDLYNPSSCPSFSPGRNLSPSPNIVKPILLPVTMTPPSSPLSAPASLPPTLWSPEDPHVPILRSIGFTVDGWTFPDGLPTGAQVCDYEQQHLWGITFNPMDELDRIHE